MESFGRYLAQQRELRGLTAADVARETRLSPTAIGALEGDRFDELPARVFVVGYLRAYARCVGLGPEELVARYDEWRVQMGLVDEEQEEAAVTPRRRMHLPPPVWPWVAGAGLIVAALWWLFA